MDCSYSSSEGVHSTDWAYVPEASQTNKEFAKDHKGKIALGALALAVIAGLVAIQLTIGYPDFGNRFVTVMNTKTAAIVSGSLVGTAALVVGLAIYMYKRQKNKDPWQTMEESTTPESEFAFGEVNYRRLSASELSADLNLTDGRRKP